MEEQKGELRAPVVIGVGVGMIFILVLLLIIAAVRRRRSRKKCKRGDEISNIFECKTALLDGKDNFNGPIVNGNSFLLPFLVKSLFGIE